MTERKRPRAKLRSSCRWEYLAQIPLTIMACSIFRRCHYSKVSAISDGINCDSQLGSSVINDQQIMLSWASIKEAMK
ncbi:hypothetical protein PG1C_02840 [Rugosibacter aromaticivorans]|uniref:Uncharacterized protein n=1 Tax=Rugosibacter aromaticivorans TaxID=1565605 RepID=A0A0C5IY93_9PROT|nr:hypothetical protein PG1C_02840 [Rugosibacter aromaticivorans]